MNHRDALNQINFIVCNAQALDVTPTTAINAISDVLDRVDDGQQAMFFTDPSRGEPFPAEQPSFPPLSVAALAGLALCWGLAIGYCVHAYFH